MTKTVHVEKPFRLLLKPGEPAVEVQPGIQPLPDEVADHWYAKLHFAGGGISAEKYAKDARDGTDAQFVRAKEAFALYVALEATCLDAETSAEVEPTEPSFTRLTGWPDTTPVMEAWDEAVDDYREKQKKAEPPEGEEDASADDKPKPRGGRAKAT